MTVEIRCQFCNAVLSAAGGNWEGEHKTWCPVLPIPEEKS